MTLHQTKLTAHQGSQHCSFEIVPQLPEMALVYKDGNEFAQLNEKVKRQPGLLTRYARLFRYV
jgi:hypothetical protein